MNKVLKDIQGSQEANMIETLSIRTMAKAVYTTENIGHYGLGFNHYYPLYFAYKTLPRCYVTSITTTLFRWR